MSQENVEIVKRAVSAINERDVDAYLALCGPDFELINPVAAIEGSNRGEQGIRSFFDALGEATTEFELEVERLESLDDHRVLGWLTLQLESERGFRQTQPLTNLYELDDGKLVRVRVFFDRAEALEATGLGEGGSPAVEGES
ncbi:MAG: nuclear transport factor 2 family protein [Solirubrobacterales bacterium]